MFFGGRPMELSSQEKKALLRKWKTQQTNKYLLSKTKVRQLFRFLEKELSVEPCDNRLSKTQLWITQHCPPRAERYHPAGDLGNGRLL